MTNLKHSKKFRSKKPKRVINNVPVQTPTVVGPPKSLAIPCKHKHIYDPTFHPRDYLTHCREGNTHTYILAAWGIHPATFRAWTKQHVELAEAAKLGRTAFNGFWHNRVRENLLSRDDDKYLNNFLFIWFSKNTMSWADGSNDEFSDSGPTMEFEILDESTGETFNAHLERIDK